MSLPGGCAIGTRPVDLLIMALERLGAEIEIDGGYVIARAKNGLRGGEIDFPKVTVGGTHTALMAAALANGTTVIENAAREPEIKDVADCLNKMGAKITGAGTSHIVIEGVPKLHGARHRVLPDRIETGTYAMAVAMTGGDVMLENARAELLQTGLDVLAQAGLEYNETNRGLRVARNGGGLAPVEVTTEPFPGFPTDLQAQLMALMTRAEGTSRITETIFENRFMHVQELARLGAHIQSRRRDRHDRRRRQAQGRAGDGDRSARLGVARHRRARGRRRDHGQPRLSPRPRLRAAGGQARPPAVPRSSASAGNPSYCGACDANGPGSRTRLARICIHRRCPCAIARMPRRPQVAAGRRHCFRPQDRRPRGRQRGRVAALRRRAKSRPRFPDGLTIVEARGQWRDTASQRIIREPSNLVMIVLSGNAEDQDRLKEVAEAYKQQFRQKSVLIVVRTACVTFSE